MRSGSSGEEFAEPSSETVDDSPMAPQETTGRYELLTPIGKGGLATVYLARDTLLDREVAIKLFEASSTNRRAMRLQDDEARRAASLEHPSLARLYDVGSLVGSDGERQTFLVMEYVRGGDLGRMLETRALTPREVAGIGLDAASALRFLHRHGLLHRDLKPQNLLLASDSQDGRLRAKITDLGIASVIGADPGAGTVAGTAAYVAPEQVEGGDPTEATDVYALGLVLLEALTGHIEFPGRHTTTVLARLDRNPIVPEGLPSPLAEALVGMTRRDPHWRISLPKVLELLERTLADYADGERTALVEPRESERIAAVRRYGVSNTEFDEALARITSLAEKRFRTKIALLSIVEEDRVWVKSGSSDGHARVEREQSVCAVAVDLGRTFSIDDVQSDEWARSNELLAQIGLQALASAPLITSDGFAIGAICVGSTTPRAWTDRELADLEDFAAIAMRELEMRVAARGAVFEV